MEAVFQEREQALAQERERRTLEGRELDATLATVKQTLEEKQRSLRLTERRAEEATVRPIGPS
eukprot:8952811-Pyramimonas_sp.AAC.2